MPVTPVDFSIASIMHAHGDRGSVRFMTDDLIGTSRMSVAPVTTAATEVNVQDPATNSQPIIVILEYVLFFVSNDTL